MTDTDNLGRQPRLPRWAPRKKAMEYAANTGSTHFNELMKSGKIKAKKDGVKVIVDLNSIDDFFEGLPDVGPENAADLRDSQTEPA
jgi:hypothetical protein